MTLNEFLKEVKKHFTSKKRKELNGACERAFNYTLKEYRR
jgi:hypothetical protein